MKLFFLYNRKLPDCFHSYLGAISFCFSLTESKVPQTQVYYVRSHSHLANIQIFSFDISLGMIPALDNSYDTLPKVGSCVISFAIPVLHLTS